MAMALHAWKTFQGATRVNFARRTIPQEVFQAATATALLFSVLAIGALTMILVVEQSSTPHPKSQGLFLDAAFEVVSALGTVGLSTGFTDSLSSWGKMIIIVLMFLGRIGPISVFVALSLKEHQHFYVLGLGSFGGALAKQLNKNGCRVTGVDSHREHVEEIKDELYEAIIADATDFDTLQQLNIKDANAVFISMGEDISPSLLATLHCKELGAKRIIVKGVSNDHGKLLKRLGVDRVIFPEAEIAATLADRVTWPNIIDFLPIDPEYSFMEVAAPDEMVGKSLMQLNLRQQYGVW
ncbi:unnamed protein product, partial [Symbiodinium sp. CCMP2456]